MNWDDAAARAALIEAVGVTEYNRLHAKHRDDSIVETVCGHAIRPVGSRFGRLFMVGDTGTAYQTIEQARDHARANPLITASISNPPNPPGSKASISNPPNGD